MSAPAISARVREDKRVFDSPTGWVASDTYQKRTGRDIPVVIVERVG